MVYRFLLTRRWLGLLVTAVLVAAGCVAMGRWQLQRLGDRHDRNDLISRNVAAPPSAVDRLFRVGREPREQDEYALVRATGRYDVEEQLLVRTRPFQGQVGYYALTPLVTRQGPALLVNRGWVPGGATATELPDVPVPPSGPVTVIVRVRPSEPASTTGPPPPGQVTRIATPSIAATLPYEVYGGYGELTREDPRPAEAPRLLPPPEPAEGPHLAYAFQWFVFAALALVGYGLLARREAADRAAAPTSPEVVRVASPGRG
jgi:cytochrome oxidase assembly protein ShyY1